MADGNVEKTRAPVVYYASNHDWFGYQHFYQGLARAFAADRKVLYVGPGTPWGSPEEAGVREVEANVWLLRARIPKGAHRRALRSLADRAVARAATSALRELHIDAHQALVWAYTTTALPFVRTARGATSVYWTGDEVVDPLEPKLLAAVDHVFTVSPLATEQKLPVAGDRVTPMPMAIDPTPFEQAALENDVPADLALLPRPIFGYGGAVNQRLDWPLVRALADATEGSVAIVGPLTDSTGREQAAALAAHPNIHFLGHRGEAEAPAYVAAFDVGLLPYRLTSFNVGSNPVKTYQYLAAGVPVVSTDLPAIAPLADVVRFGSDVAEFVAESINAATAPRTTRDRDARQAVARLHSYEALVHRVDQVLATRDVR